MGVYYAVVTDVEDAKAAQIFLGMVSMHTPMRRKNLERRDPEFIGHVLHRAEDIYVAFSTQDAPYVVPVNFVYVNDKIYFHSALEGRKLECIKENPKVGFSTAVDVVVIQEDATTYYNSIIGTGSAHIVEDATEKGLVLDALAKRFDAPCEQPATQKMIAKTCVVCITVESICGKKKDTHIKLNEVI